MKRAALPFLFLIIAVLGCTPSRSGSATQKVPPSPTPTLTAAEMKDERQSAIWKLERKFLEQGMDVHFDWPKKDTLRMKYVLMSRPTVYQIENQTDFLDQLRRLGVKKVIFTDGFRETWTVEP